ANLDPELTYDQPESGASMEHPIWSRRWVAIIAASDRRTFGVASKNGCCCTATQSNDPRPTGFLARYPGCMPRAIQSRGRDRCTTGDSAEAHRGSTRDVLTRR